MNKIAISRINYAPTYTLGFIKHADFFCFTLEPAKTVGKGCIPCGTYPIKWEWSKRFQRNLWELKEVPDFDEVKIHEGNTVANTLGCPLLGFSFDSASDPIRRVVLGNSHRAVTVFNDICHDEKITHIEVREI